MITFGIVVDCNNLLALKSFHTFLFNYELHESPKIWERFVIKWSKKWIRNEAMKTLKDLQTEVIKNEVNLGINDCSTGIFTALYTAQSQNNLPEKQKVKTGEELFLLLAETELEFEKMKKQKQPDIQHG